MKTAIFATFFLTFLADESNQFKPPDATARQKAIGSLDDLPDALIRALTPGKDFQPIPAPGPHDWLANHDEPGQTFDQFRRFAANKPDKERPAIYLQPLGAFSKKEDALAKRWQAFAAAYFAGEVKLLEPLALDAIPLTTRTNSFTGKRQILSTDVLTALTKRLPGDAFCLLAFTMEDLYPDAEWNFVFGQASLRRRVGVFSFARHDPAFFGRERSEGHETTMLRRSGKVLAHETGHMFGIKHCIYFDCLMNGSNHLAESDARSLHLCPVCLRKMHHSVGFDIPGRYGKLRALYRKTGLIAESTWIEKRVRFLSPK